MRTVQVPVTVKVGTLSEVGPAGYQLAWLAGRGDGGRAYELTCGAGVGNPLIQAVLTDGGAALCALVDIRPVAGQLFGLLDEALGADGEPPDGETGPGVPEPEDAAAAAAALDSGTAAAAGTGEGPPEDTQPGGSGWHAARAGDGDGEPCQDCGQSVVVLEWEETTAYSAVAHVSDIDAAFARHDLITPAFIALTGPAGIAMADVLASLHDHDQPRSNGISSWHVRTVRYIPSQEGTRQP